MARNAKIFLESVKTDNNRVIRGFFFFCIISRITFMIIRTALGIGLQRVDEPSSISKAKLFDSSRFSGAARWIQ